MENIVRLIGTVGQVVPEKSFIQILTSAMSRDKEYVTSHAVEVAEFNEKLMKPGNKLEIRGEFAQHNKRTVIKATSIVKVAKTTEDVNVGKVSGTTAGEFQYFPRRGSKSPFGNLLVNLGEMVVRAVLFNQSAFTFSRDCTRGSEVEVLGRVNYRTNKLIDDDGQQIITKFTEIVAFDGHTKLTKIAEVIDPLTGLPVKHEALPEPEYEDAIPF